MFGGIGGEVLYRPFNKDYSLGLSTAPFKQRDYDQRFSFRDYETTTGHFSCIMICRMRFTLRN